MTPNRRPSKAGLVAAMREHHNAPDLAREFGISRQAMYNYLRYYGLTIDPPKSKVESILASNPDMRLSALARKLKASRSKTLRLLKKYELAMPNRFRAQVTALYADGTTAPSDVARALGCSYTKARRTIQALDLDGSGRTRGAIRARLPACVACTDPVDPDDGAWSGSGELHFTCARWMLLQRVVVPDEMDLIMTGDAVAWITTRQKTRRGVVKSFLGDIAHVQHGANAYQVPASRLSKIVL